MERWMTDDSALSHTKYGSSGVAAGVAEVYRFGQFIFPHASSRMAAPISIRDRGQHLSCCMTYPRAIRARCPRLASYEAAKLGFESVTTH